MMVLSVSKLGPAYSSSKIACLCFVGSIFTPSIANFISAGYLGLERRKIHRDDLRDATIVPSWTYLHALFSTSKSGLVYLLIKLFLCLTRGCCVPSKKKFFFFDGTAQHALVSHRLVPFKQMLEKCEESIIPYLPVDINLIGSFFCLFLFQVSEQLLMNKVTINVFILTLS